MKIILGRYSWLNFEFGMMKDKVSFENSYKINLFIGKNDSERFEFMW